MTEELIEKAREQAAMFSANRGELIHQLGDALEAVTKERDRLKAAIEAAKASEERSHKVLTNRKPKLEDSSQTWRILSAALNEGKTDDQG